MRLLTIFLLILPTVAALADGMTLTLGERLNRLQETDQVAIINLDSNGATVDMYIAIEGIPAGETVTFILPFWHKPQGFTLEKLDGKTFGRQYLRPVQYQVRDYSRDKYMKMALKLLYQGGTGVVGPFALINILACILMPTFAGHSLTSYETHSVPGAEVEMFHVAEKHLPALVAQAGMPERYAKYLRRYDTEYFAVMHLHGVEKSAKDSEERIAQGVHYHFRHPMANSSSFTYTYPLGTGAGWPKPIMLTDVYITCPLGWKLNVTAPVYGEKESYLSTLSRAGQYYRFGTVTNEFDAESQRYFFTPHYSSLMDNDSHRFPVWHRAYYATNPTEDIIVHCVKGSDYLAIRIVDALMNEYSMLVLILAGLVFSWWVAIRLYLYRRLVHLNKLSCFPGEIQRALRSATIYGAIGSLCSIPILGIFISSLILAAVFIIGYIVIGIWSLWMKVHFPLFSRAKYDLLDLTHVIAWITYVAFALTTIGLVSLATRFLVG